METYPKRLRKCSGISLAAILFAAFTIIQPGMQVAYSLGVEGLPGYDDCQNPIIIEDPISMNTVRSGNVVKTVHAEKEVNECLQDQGGIEITVEVTTYIELYENIVTKEVISASALAVTCITEPSLGVPGGATVIDCESYDIPSTPVPVGSNCQEDTSGTKITHPQEMNTVNKGNIAKTMEAQKEVFFCFLNENDVFKKVDLILFTEIYEDLTTQTVTDVQFHSMRCVVLVSNDRFQPFDPDDDIRDQTVESCQFSTINN